MKSYYDFMFLVLCVLRSKDSSVGTKNWKNWKTPKKLKICHTQKNSGNFAKPKKNISKKLPTKKNRICPNFKS